MPLKSPALQKSPDCGEVQYISRGSTSAPSLARGATVPFWALSQRLRPAVAKKTPPTSTIYPNTGAPPDHPMALVPGPHVSALYPERERGGTIVKVDLRSRVRPPPPRGRPPVSTVRTGAGWRDHQGGEATFSTLSP